MRYNTKVRKNVYVPLAQLDRVFGYEPKGRGFESLKARQTKSRSPKGDLLFVFRFFMLEPLDGFSQTKIHHNVRTVS